MLLNSGTLGYARVVLDQASIPYFLQNIDKIDDQLDRTYMWMILRDHIVLCEVSPKSYLECIISNIMNENEQSTLNFLLNQFSHILTYWIEDKDQDELSSRAFTTLIEKVKSIENESLRNLIVNHTLDFASTPEQVQLLREFLTQKSIPLNQDG